MSKKRKRKGKVVSRIIIGILFCISAGFGAKAGFLQIEMSNAIQRPTTGSALKDVEVESTVVYNQDVVNILLIGADKREEWNDTGRSDSTMIATVDLKDKELKLTSLMRDMYVPIPGHDSNKFNAAYAFGGVELLYQTIANNFNIKLDGYVIVDFKAFQDIIDELGGVDLELSEWEANYLNTAYHGKLNVEVGMQTLTGKEALAYCRIRQDAQGDFGRTERQRKLLSAIFNEFKGQSLGKLEKLAIKLLGNISTDLTDEQIFSLMKSVLLMGTTDIQQFRVPVDNSYTSQRINNMAVLVPDLEVNRLALHDFIFGTVDNTSTETGVGTPSTEGVSQ